MSQPFARNVRRCLARVRRQCIKNRGFSCISSFALRPSFRPLPNSVLQSLRVRRRPCSKFRSASSWGRGTVHGAVGASCSWCVLLSSISLGEVKPTSGAAPRVGLLAAARCRPCAVLRTWSWPCGSVGVGPRPARSLAVRPAVRAFGPRRCLRRPVAARQVLLLALLASSLLPLSSGVSLIRVPTLTILAQALFLVFSHLRAFPPHSASYIDAGSSNRLSPNSREYLFDHGSPRESPARSKGRLLRQYRALPLHGNEWLGNCRGTCGAPPRWWRESRSTPKHR